MTSEIRVDLTGGVLTMTLARPDKKNALTNEMYGALADTIEQAQQDRNVRVLLLQGDGDLFTSGNDVAEFAAIAAGKGPSERHVHRFLRALANSTVPTVAAVNGKAVGVGATMLLHCDYVALSEDAQLITPFVNLALVPEAASSYLLPLRIGHVRAFEMFALGEPLDAQTAVAWGIANKTTPGAATSPRTRMSSCSIPITCWRHTSGFPRPLNRYTTYSDGRLRRNVTGTAGGCASAARAPEAVCRRPHRGWRWRTAGRRLRCRCCITRRWTS